MDEQADDWESHDSLCEQPLRNREETGGDNAKPKSSISSRGRGPKRPDKPLYMPRAARERLSLQSSQDPSGEHGLPGPASSSFISTSCDSSFCTETAEKTSTTSRQECPLSVAEGISHHAGDSSAICPQEEEEKLLTVDEDEPLVWQKTMSSFNDMTLEEDETGKEDECTDSDDVTEEVCLLFFFFLNCSCILLIYTVIIASFFNLLFFILHISITNSNNMYFSCLIRSRHI